MLTVSQIAQWCAPWNHLFGHNKLVSGTVTGAHILALVFAGGFAIASDRSTLRAHTRDRAARIQQLDETAAIHRPVLLGLVVLFVSGLLLALSDVETFLPSWIFWVKLALVALLLVNGAVLTRNERALHECVKASTAADAESELWSRVRALAMSSIVLWTATAIAGLVLSNAA